MYFYLASVFVLLYLLVSAGEAGAGRMMLLSETSAAASQGSGRSDHLRQYLYFCTSKASKLNLEGRITQTLRAHARGLVGSMEV